MITSAPIPEPPVTIATFDTECARRGFDPDRTELVDGILRETHASLPHARATRDVVRFLESRQ